MSWSLELYGLVCAECLHHLFRLEDKYILHTHLSWSLLLYGLVYAECLHHLFRLKDKYILLTHFSWYLVLYGLMYAECLYHLLRLKDKYFLKNIFFIVWLQVCRVLISFAWTQRQIPLKNHGILYYFQLYFVCISIIMALTLSSLNFCNRLFRLWTWTLGKSVQKSRTEWQNRVDSDETACYEPSHLDLHCLHKYLFWPKG